MSPTVLLTSLTLTEQSVQSASSPKKFLICKHSNARSAPLIQNSIQTSISANKSYTLQTIKRYRTICLTEQLYPLILTIRVPLVLPLAPFLMGHVSNVLYPAIGVSKRINAKIVLQAKFLTLTLNCVRFLKEIP